MSVIFSLPESLSAFARACVRAHACIFALHASWLTSGDEQIGAVSIAEEARGIKRCGREVASSVWGIVTGPPPSSSCFSTHAFGRRAGLVPRCSQVFFHRTRIVSTHESGHRILSRYDPADPRYYDQLAKEPHNDIEYIHEFVCHCFCASCYSAALGEASPFESVHFLMRAGDAIEGEIGEAEVSSALLLFLQASQRHLPKASFLTFLLLVSI